MILNSLPGDLLRASWRCCAEFGRFVELGKTDIQDRNSLEMSVFERSATFTAFDLTDLYHSNNARLNQVWSQ